MHRLLGARRLALAAVSLAAGFAVGGCDSTDTLAALDPDASVAVTSEAQPVAAQAAWEASGVDDYEFVYELRCYCSPGERVVVRGGRAVRTTRRDLAEARTIDDLFDDALRDLRYAATAEQWAAEVRLSTGRPQIPVLIHSGTTNLGIADGFTRLVVTGFETR